MSLPSTSYSHLGPVTGQRLVRGLAAHLTISGRARSATVPRVLERKDTVKHRASVQTFSLSGDDQSASSSGSSSLSGGFGSWRSQMLSHFRRHGSLPGNVLTNPKGRGSTVQLRAGGNSKRSSLTPVTNSLVSVLRDEVKYEQESYRKDELLVEGPPNEFELQDEQGSVAFFLAKIFGPNEEEIVVRVSLDAQVEASDDDEEDEDEDDNEEFILPVQFQVCCLKERSMLVFEIESDGDYVAINSMSLEAVPEGSAGGLAELVFGRQAADEDGPEGGRYSGPPFESLDTTLQQAFMDFLDERGINAELGSWLQAYVRDKQALEYQTWLKRVRDFISS